MTPEVGSNYFLFGVPAHYTEFYQSHNANSSDVPIIYQVKLPSSIIFIHDSLSLLRYHKTPVKAVIYLKEWLKFIS